MTHTALAVSGPDGPASMGAIDARVFRSVMGHFATGVTVVTNRVEGRPMGMTANAFMSVSIDPPLVLVSVRRASRFAAQVTLGDPYGVSVLRESQRHLSAHFGGRPIEGIDVPFLEHDGVPLIRDALAHVTARVVAIHAAGDHQLFVGRVEHLRLGEQDRPLIFYAGGYREVQADAPIVSWTRCDGW